MSSVEKLIVVSTITLFLIIGFICLVTLDIPIIASSSISSILGKNGEIVQKEAKLLSEQTSYKTLVASLDNLKANFEKEKGKYEAISDETINIIKESNTEENYSLEYMWIKLGNYAKKNNLTLVMIEPGNTNITTNENEASDQSVVANNTTKLPSSSNVLQIQVTGNYINLSDFIFEVENDSELKFKLDNISMELVSGTTIRTTFDVKNIIINK